MSACLVTGNPGSGKSDLAAELSARGLVALDPDHDPQLSYWDDGCGGKVYLEDGPTTPDRQWLQSHRWVWGRRRMEALLAEDDAPIFVCGIALNIDEVVDLVDAVFLLEIDAGTQEARLASHDEQHPPGRGEAGRQQIRDGRLTFQAHMRGLGAVALDGTAPTPAVADELLAHIASAGTQ